MTFSFTSSGSFANIENFLKRALESDITAELNVYGQRGVDALASATPVGSGETAAGWRYRIIKHKNGTGIEWYNVHEVDGVNVAIILQYGHATGTGGYVQGIDYINPAIRPIFDEIADGVWKKVTT